jgi:uncharacterized short protein YbdD (DUF466 family)
MAFARTAASQLRHGWLHAIGAPDYQAYLAHHAQRHPGTPPLSEREYVNVFIERRHNRRGAAAAAREPGRALAARNYC